MKKSIFCLIAVVAIATLLLSPGQSFAGSKWIPWDLGTNDLETENWEVQSQTNVAGDECYEYEVVDGRLKVSHTGESGCAGLRIFFKVTNPAYTEMQVYLTVDESFNCHRARIVADFINTADGKEIFHQFSLVGNINQSCPYSVMSRLMSYVPWDVMFDGFFKGPWGYSLPIVGETYLLRTAVQKNSFDCELENTMGESYGKIKLEVPGGRLSLPNKPYLGLSCFSPYDDSSGVVWFENPMVR